VCEGDKVKVQGKRANEIGEVTAIESDWENSPYMQCVVEVLQDK
jgi:hypothetical protein